MEKFKQQVVAYKNKIQNIDAKLEINESTHVCQDGEHIVVYSIDTPTKACFGVTLTVISPKKARFLIEFNNADEDWNTDNIYLFTSFISGLTNYGWSFDEIKTAVDTMLESDHYRFNSKASLSWDDYHSTLYYTETF